MNVIKNNSPNTIAPGANLSLAKNVEFLRHFPKLNGFNGLGIYGRSTSPGASSPLVEISGFGTNPGALKMFAYVPEPLPRATSPGLNQLKQVLALFAPCCSGISNAKP